MKKLLLSVALFGATFSMNAQLDTLTEFFTGTPTFYSSSGGGYVTGNNAYNDRAKMQLFDAQTGVTGTGTISSLLAWVPAKAGTGTLTAKIWANNAGAPGAELGSVAIDLTAIDTNLTAIMPVGAWGYNVNATFSSPIAIPANGFWAGFELPDNATGSIVIVGNTDADFALGTTHAGEFWEDLTFHTFGDAANWGLNIAMAIFPAVDMVAGIEQNVISSKVYPNPANDVLNIAVNEEIASVSIVTLDGKVVATSTGKTVDIANLTSGMYIYEVTTANGNVARDTFMKN